VLYLNFNFKNIILFNLSLSLNRTFQKSVIQEFFSYSDFFTPSAKKNSFSHEYAKVYQTEIEKLDFLS
jgi:hypothetical protein